MCIFDVNERGLNVGNQQTNRWLVVLLHVVAVTTFIMSPLLFFGPPNDARRPPPLREGNYRSPLPEEIPQHDIISMQRHAVLLNVVLIALFYLNMYVLVPRILTKKNWLYYAGLIVFCFLIVWALNSFFDHFMIRDGLQAGRPLFFITINFLLVFGLSTALRLTSDRLQFEREREQRENENLKSELSLLRSQVSPHFMFNILNSLASLARKKSDELEPVIIQLSQLMRYMLYEGAEMRTTIEREIEYLTNYIDLQKLRFGNDITVSFRVNVTRRDLFIEPMLFIPFVENAFKHGSGLVMDPVIDIELASDENSVRFVVRNKFSSATQAKDPSSGIGIQNVRRRLDLLYKQLYTLILTHDGDWFRVELNLKLK